MPTVNLDTSARLDIICRRGDTFDLTVDFNTSLSSYPASSWQLQVRNSDTDNSGTPVIDVDGTTGVHPGTSGFIVSGETLRIIINDGSSGMDVDGGLYVYDLQTDASGTRTWLHGEFKIIEDITT